MNKKIKKYMEEIHKTEQKIADLQQYLKGLHAALKQEEDNEMIKSIRGMKLDSHARHDLLCFHELFLIHLSLMILLIEWNPGRNRKISGQPGV